jgi:hypothetical protein
MTTVSNREIRNLVTNREVFKTHNGTVFSENKDNLYVVYSYGHHFPMYAYDAEAREWFGNADKYSPTTSRHQSYARPDSSVEFMPSELLRSLVDRGSYAAYCAKHVRGWDYITA